MPPKEKEFEYTSLENEHLRQIIQERIANIEREHYNHQLNLTLAIANPEIGEEQVESTRAALKFIESAHATLTAELKKIPKE